MCWQHVLHGNEDQPKLLHNIATHTPKKIGYYNPIKSNYHTGKCKWELTDWAEQSNLKPWTHLFLVFVLYQLWSKNAQAFFSAYRFPSTSKSTPATVLVLFSTIQNQQINESDWNNKTTDSKFTRIIELMNQLENLTYLYIQVEVLILEQLYKLLFCFWIWLRYQDIYNKVLMRLNQQMNQNSKRKWKCAMNVDNTSFPRWRRVCIQKIRHRIRQFIS